MATLLSSVNPMTPVTPPPENMNFPRAPFEARVPQLKRTADEAKLDDGHFHPKAEPQAQAASSSQSQAHQLPPSQFPGPNPPMDPRYVAMLQRITTYYQQRTQAMANFQHQRCQAWANMHRQKCQEMMQASMLVVAWYIRDRISRRRRKDKRRFRAGLREKSSPSTKVVRGETVRRWVLAVPEVTLPPNVPMSTTSMADPEEAQFNIDREVTPDKDAKLFEMADNLIRSQYRKIEVPLMGTLDFEASDSESESEQDEDNNEDVEEGEARAAGDDGDEEDEEDYEDMDEDDDFVDYDDEDAEYEEDEEQGSELVHNGTGPGSGHNETTLSS